MAQIVKNMPTMQKNWVRSLGQEDPLEKGMATYSSILAWEMPWTEAWWATVHGDWNAKVGSQEIPGGTRKFGFGVQT